eukprot:9502623-Pyramimonas_sp.AAC.2
MAKEAGPKHSPVWDGTKYRCANCLRACSDKSSFPRTTAPPTLARLLKEGGGPGHSIHVARVVLSALPVVHCVLRGMFSSQKALSLFAPCTGPKKSNE